MKNSIILEVTNDEYELIVDLFDSTKELAIKCGTNQKNIIARINRPPKHKKTKYVRVWLKEYEQ